MSPTAPLRPCPQPGCPTLGCQVHTARAAYDRWRGSARQRGYDRRHEAWRLAVRAASGPLCTDPDRRHPDRPIIGTVADHVVPLTVWQRDARAAAHALALVLTARGVTFTGEDLDAWSLHNGQWLCAPCHLAKTMRESRGG